jgi:chaperone BCS1
VIRLAEARKRSAFYLTAHFSQEDYPYDWHVRSITLARAYSCHCLSQVDALAFQGRFRPVAIEAVTELLSSPRGKKQQPAWGRSREFEITTRSVCRNQLNQSTTGDVDEEEEMEEEDEHELEHGRRKRKVTFMPSPGKQIVRSALALARTRFFQTPRIRFSTAVIG